MKGIKKVLAGAMALVVLCSITSFGGVRAEAKDVPKYLKDDTIFISEAYMYGDKALTKCDDINLYYKKKVQNYCFEDQLYPLRISKKYAYATDYKQHVLFNIEDGTKQDGFPMIEKMNKAVDKKYNINFGFTTKSFVESDTDIFWLQFMFVSNGKFTTGLVSSNGEVIELPFKEGDAYEISMHNNKAYVLYEEKGQYNISVYSADQKEANLCTIDKDNEKEYLQGLVVNKDDNMYITCKSEEGLEKGQEEISKINKNDGKGTLTTIAKYNYEKQHPSIKTVAVDNNENIWYLQDGLIYKIENDKPVLKYEVQKNKTNLFVSDDNNLIVSGAEYEQCTNPVDPCYNVGHSTIINLSDKYTNGWVKEGNSWYYYIDRQCVNSDWKQIDGAWYCFNADGKMLTGWINDEGNNWYYLNDNGSMVTGWKMLQGQWYYLKGNGQAAIGWNYADGTWYYFNQDASMVTGWKQVDGAWYYLNGNGTMANGWKQISGSWYYFYDNGSMACNTTIGGYKIGSNGAMI